MKYNRQLWKYAQLGKLIQAFSEPYSGQIFHYTSADGIVGIIDNHEIWMTNTAFMNDTTELRMLGNCSDMLKDNDFTNDFVKHEWHTIFEQLNFNKDMPNYYYMASFSKEKDLLEQWRAYGNFCIGFEAKKLRAGRRVSSFSCLYTENDIRRWILSKEKINKWKDLMDDEEKRIAAYDLLYVASMKYKNSHFKNEKEVRLVAISHHNWIYDNSPEMYEGDLPIHFRRHPMHGFPIPYVKFFIGQDNWNNAERVKEKEQEMKKRKLKEEGSKERKLLPITEVIIGPIAHQEEAKSACEILLAEKGYKGIRVSISKIPYRGV